MQHKQPTLLNLGQAAALLGIHRGTVRRWIARGIIRGIRVGKSWRIPRQAIVELAEGHE